MLSLGRLQEEVFYVDKQAVQAVAPVHPSEDHNEQGQEQLP